MSGDFNGDGFVDLAIGVPGETWGENIDIGTVRVIYGSVDGLSAADADTWNDANTGGWTESGDRFGESLTS